LLLVAALAIPRPGPVLADATDAKIEASLAQDAGQGNVEMIVALAEQAELSGAASLATKAEKGTYVVRRLTEVATRTQGPLLNALRDQGVACQSFWVANVIWVRGDLRTARFLAQRSEVRRVSGNRPIYVETPVAEKKALREATSTGYNLPLVRAPEAWALGFKGQGVVIGGQDTGYQWDHPALIRQYRGWDGASVDHNYNWHDSIHQRDPHNYGQNPCGYNLLAPCDDYGHGTHTMGIMVGDDGGTNQIGMAPLARWIASRNMESGWGTPASYTESFQWFLAPTDLNGQNPDPSKAPDVINNSWTCPLSEGCNDPQILKTIVENVRAAGIVIVASAGNDGPSCGSVFEPGATYDATFTVGSTDSADRISLVSGRGPVTVDGSNRLKPDIVAPGVSIYSCTTGNRYTWMSGTSMASPHVAGLVALLICAHPELRGQVDGLERIIGQTAVQLTTGETCGGVSGAEVPNNTFGWGRIDAVAALGLVDTDGDGMPDWWELWHQLDPRAPADADLDPDGDGNTNLAEYLAGTDPNDSNSFFHLAAIKVDQVCRVMLASAVNRRYTLVVGDQLHGGTWTPVPGATDVLGTGRNLVLTAPLATPQAEARFYQVRVGLN
jgi:subtilisin family serine protease